MNEKKYAILYGDYSRQAQLLKLRTATATSAIHPEYKVVAEGDIFDIRDLFKRLTEGNAL